MLIDAHTHVFPPEILRNREHFIQTDAWFAECYSNPRCRAVDSETLIASMDAAGIDKSVVMGFCWNDSGLCTYNNDYIIDTVHQYPERLIGLATPRPSDGAKAVAELERCLDAGLKGIGELNADAQNFDLLDFATLEPLLNAASEHQVPVLLHTSEPVGHIYPGKGTSLPQKLYQLIVRFPDLRLVCAHWGGGLFFYELMPEVANAAKNVCYDTAASTLLYDPRIFAIAMSIIGSHKILFGSDYPLLRQDRFLDTLRALAIETQAVDDMLGNNAMRVFVNG